MTFISPYFLFLFLPAVLLAYRICQQAKILHLSVKCLVLASFVFYAVWDYRFVPLLLTSALFNFMFASKLDAAASPKARKRLFILSLVFNLLLLCFFKYSAFLLTNLNLLYSSSPSTLDIVLPLGISFFTFTQIGYLVDVFKGMPAERRLDRYLLFVSYFPHLVAGPIFHAREMMPQFSRRLGQPLVSRNVAVGLAIFIIGFAKKALIADNLAVYASPVFDAAATGYVPFFLEAWSALLAYSLQIYFDFSGYCDMAIGLSFFFGVRLPINFNSPYKATSIIDFWRRWHITLSRYLRDYLYIPLGGGKSGLARQLVNIHIVMLLGGLWHGAGWTFIVWGGLHGLLLSFNHAWRRLFPSDAHSFLVTVSCRILTFLCVTLAWTFFRSADFTTAGIMLSALSGHNGVFLPIEWLRYSPIAHFSALLDLPAQEMRFFLGFDALLAISLGLGLVWLFPNSQEIMSRFSPILERQPLSGNPALRWRPHWSYAAFMSGLLAFSLQRAIFQEPSPFLYFQF